MIDVTSVVVNEKKNEVVITGVDLDSIWIHRDEPTEDEECTETSYKFDTTLSGARKYLYLVTKNNKKASEFKYMDERLQALVGQTTIEEAAEYSNIGINKIRELLIQPRCTFVLYIGKKKLVKRKEFLDYISKSIEL